MIHNSEIHKRLHEMSEDELLALDPLCVALAEVETGLPLHCVPNRIIALAVRDLFMQWQHEELNKHCWYSA